MKQESEGNCSSNASKEGRPRYFHTVQGDLYLGDDLHTTKLSIITINEDEKKVRIPNNEMLCAPENVSSLLWDQLYIENYQRGDNSPTKRGDLLQMCLETCKQKGKTECPNLVFKRQAKECYIIKQVPRVEQERKLGQRDDDCKCPSLVSWRIVTETMPAFYHTPEVTLDQFSSMIGCEDVNGSDLFLGKDFHRKEAQAILAATTTCARF